LSLPPWPDFAFEVVDGEIQAAEVSGFVGFLDAADGEFRNEVFLCSAKNRTDWTPPAAGSALSIRAGAVFAVRSRAQRFPQARFDGKGQRGSVGGGHRLLPIGIL